MVVLLSHMTNRRQVSYAAHTLNFYVLPVAAIALSGPETIRFRECLKAQPSYLNRLILEGRVRIVREIAFFAPK
ncbi:MAG: hypothetical protein JW713_16605 [Pontiellaceae bacterium]|nr:hypothetical protein [Pontiellaceae bacterium]